MHSRGCSYIPLPSQPFRSRSKERPEKEACTDSRNIFRIYYIPRASPSTPRLLCSPYYTADWSLYLIGRYSWRLRGRLKPTPGAVGPPILSSMLPSLPQPRPGNKCTFCPRGPLQGFSQASAEAVKSQSRTADNNIPECIFVFRRLFVNLKILVGLKYKRRYFS